MKKSILSTGIIAVALTSVLLLTGCTQNPSTHSAKPSATSTTIPTPNVGKPVKVTGTSALELQYAEQAYPNVTKYGKFTKQQVQLSLLTTGSYIQASLDTPSFVNGTFVKDGLPTNELEQYFQNYFKFSTWSDVEAQITANPSTLLQIAYAPSLTSAYTPTDNCTKLGLCASAPTVTITSYNTATDGTLLVKATGSTNVFVNYNGQAGVIPVTYKYALNFTPNQFADFSAGKPAMVISGYQNSYQIDSWKATTT
jgi:hypothetical protein